MNLDTSYPLSMETIRANAAGFAEGRFYGFQEGYSTAVRELSPATVHAVLELTYANLTRIQARQENAKAASRLLSSYLSRKAHAHRRETADRERSQGHGQSATAHAA